MLKYKIIIILILFCFFQTTPSISLELKIPKDLKKLGDAVKKELDKNKGKKESKKTEKKEVKKDKISNCTVNNNYIYYSDVANDEYFKQVWRKNITSYEKRIANYSFIVKLFSFFIYFTIHITH